MTQLKSKLIRNFPIEEMTAAAQARGFKDATALIRWWMAREIKKHNKAKRNLNKR